MVKTFRNSVAVFAARSNLGACHLLSVDSASVSEGCNPQPKHEVWLRKAAGVGPNDQ
jgi:hypothetical protein